jgi:hypothetical protein
MTDTIALTERLRFDAIRCEMHFSTGVASNITEAADRIEQLEAALQFYAEKDNWYPSQHLKGVVSGKYYTPVESDGGYKASAALDEGLPTAADVRGIMALNPEEST